MQFFRNLYLSDRLFFALGLCAFLFFASYQLEALYTVAVIIGVITAVSTLIDIIVLFGKQHITAERKTALVYSLNEENPVKVTLHSKSQFLLHTKVVDEVPHQFNMRDFSAKVLLGPGTNETLKYNLRPQLRGEYGFGNIHVFISTKIGLAVKKESTEAAVNIAVYPSVPHMLRQELIAMQHPSFVEGGNKNRKMGRSYEFDQIKVYQPGDDTRSINWKASSTMNQVMVNYYEDERSQQIYSIVDKSRVMKMPFNGLTLVDYAINSTLALSNIILKKQDKAGLILFSQKTDGQLKADKGPRQLKKIMYALYKEKYDYSEADFETLYLSIRTTIPNRSLLFLYTNFDSMYALERCLPALRLINQRHLLVVIFFENSELKAYSEEPSKDILDIYRRSLAKKAVLEKNQIHRELIKHGIQSIRCTPEQLSVSSINKYLELKMTGAI